MQRSRLLSPAGRFLGVTPVAVRSGYRLGQLDYGTDVQAEEAQAAAANTTAWIKQLLGGIPQGSSVWLTYTAQLDNCLSMLNSGSLTGMIAGGTCLYSLYQSVRNYLDQQEKDKEAAKRAQEEADRAKAVAAKAAADKAAADALARQSSGSEWLWILAGGAVAGAAVILLQ